MPAFVFPPDHLAAGYAAVRDLRATVFHETSPAKLREYNGGIVVPCLDGNHFDDLYGHHRNLSPTRRLAPVTKPGGGVCLTPGSLLEESSVDGHIVNERLSALNSIDLGVHKLGIRACCLYGHFPCAACCEAGIDVRAQLQLLVNAKLMLKLRYTRPDAPFVVALLFHVAHLNADGSWGKRRTYHARCEDILDWLASWSQPPVQSTSLHLEASSLVG